MSVRSCSSILTFGNVSVGLKLNIAPVSSLCVFRYSLQVSVKICRNIYKQEVQLPQRDRATRYVSKFMLCFTSFIIFHTLNVTFKVIQGHWQWFLSIGHIYDFLLVFHCNYV